MNEEPINAPSPDAWRERDDYRRTWDPRLWERMNAELGLTWIAPMRTYRELESLLSTGSLPGGHCCYIREDPTTFAVTLDGGFYMISDKAGDHVLPPIMLGVADMDADELRELAEKNYDLAEFFRGRAAQARRKANLWLALTVVCWGLILVVLTAPDAWFVSAYEFLTREITITW